MKEKVLSPKQYAKKGSPNYLVVAPNKSMNSKKHYPDWFIDITLYSNKSNELKECTTVIKDDLSGHMKMYIIEGWKETEYVDIFAKTSETNNEH